MLGKSNSCCFLISWYRNVCERNKRYGFSGTVHWALSDTSGPLFDFPALLPGMCYLSILGVEIEAHDMTSPDLSYSSRSCSGHLKTLFTHTTLASLQNLHLSKSKPTEHALVLACNGTNGESKPDSDTKPLSLMENGHISNSQDEDRALKIWFWNSSLSLENVENTMAVLGGLGYFIGCWMNEWNPRKRAFGVPGESAI